MKNSRYNSSDQDEPFLQNFDSSVQKPDFFANLCKSEHQANQLSIKQILKEEMQDEQLSKKSSLNDSVHCSKSKQKKKIFYRDKMAELMKPGQYIKQEYNYITYNQIQQNRAPISREEQLKRNRQSAKNSRQRKKEYVVALQQKNDQYARNIQQLSYKLQQVTLERDRLKQYNHQEIKNFLKSQAEAYERLESIVKNPNSRTDQIKLQVFEMLQKFGTSGTARISVMNYYMNEIIEDMISDIQKYFLNSSSFSQSFNSLQLKPIDRDVMRILDLDVSKITYIMQRYKERFHKESTVYKDLTQQLYRVFTSIQNQGKVIQVVFTDMIKELDFKKIGELILYFEQNRFCREVKRVRRQWIQQLKTGETVIETIRKQTKQE